MPLEKICSGHLSSRIFVFVCGTLRVAKLMEQPFARVVNRLQKLLEAASVKLQIRIRIALIGGLAVSAWGAIRATQDIDLLADSDPSPIGSRPIRDDLQRFFEAKHCIVEWRVGDSDGPIPLLLRLNLGGALSQPGADILWAHQRWQQEALQRRLEVRSGKLRVFVLHPEDLILTKLDAGGRKICSMCKPCSAPGRLT